MRTLVRLIPFLSLALIAGPAPADSSDSPQAGYLGILLQRVEGGLAEALDLKEDSGVLISQVVDDSPAAQAGLKAGDIVTRIGDTDVHDPTELRSAVRDHHEGDRVKVQYLRSGKKGDTDVTLGGAESNGDWEPSPGARFFSRGMGSPHDMRAHRSRELRVHGNRGYLGVSTQSLGGDLGKYFGVADGKGALVAEVVDDSPAAKLGLQAGDVIVKVDDRDIDDPDTLGDVIRGYQDPTTVEVVWIRDKKEKRGKVELDVHESRAWLDAAPLADLDLDLDLGAHRKIRVERIEDDVDRQLDELRDQLGELRKQVEELRGDK